jgi:hypothetical protein
MNLTEKVLVVNLVDTFVELSTFKPWQAWRTPPDHLFMQYRGHPTFEMLAGDGYKEDGEHVGPPWRHL